MCVCYCLKNMTQIRPRGGLRDSLLAQDGQCPDKPNFLHRNQYLDNMKITNDRAYIAIYILTNLCDGQMQECRNLPHHHLWLLRSQTHLYYKAKVFI